MPRRARNRPWRGSVIVAFPGTKEKPTLMELLPGGANAKDGGGRMQCSVSRSTGVSYVESIVLPKERSDLGRGIEEHKELEKQSSVWCRQPFQRSAGVPALRKQG